MSNIDYSNKHFLVIDNIKASHDVLKKFAMSLTSKRVDSTHYAQDAIPLCLEKQYDVVFLGYDLGEKQKNGQQILEELRLSQVISLHCVVIIITAEISQAMVLAALEHKPDSYLCKPYTVKELGKRLNNCIRKKETMAFIYRALEEDDRDLAIELVDLALEKSTPYRMECLGIKARQLFELQRYDEAKAIYNAHKSDINCTWANIGLGKIALQENKITNAEAIFKEVIRQKPLYLPGYDWLANTYENTQNLFFAEDILEQALKISPRSVLRLKKYAGLCFDNKHYEKATKAYDKVYQIAHNSIHHCPENALLYANSLAHFSTELPVVQAKKMHNKAFGMLSQVNKSFNQPNIKIQSYLLSACLFENVQEYNIAKGKLDQGLTLLELEQHNIDTASLKNIANSLIKLDRQSKASQILVSVDERQQNITTSTTNIGDISPKKLNNNYTAKAQKALNTSKELYELKKYNEAINALKEALILYPNHIGIKLNLLHILLESYEESDVRQSELMLAKKLILELISKDKDEDEKLRFKKIKRKYQQLASFN